LHIKDWETKTTKLLKEEKKERKLIKTLCTPLITASYYVNPTRTQKFILISTVESSLPDADCTA
jgi:hypothetical protein